MVYQIHNDRTQEQIRAHKNSLMASLYLHEYQDPEREPLPWLDATNCGQDRLRPLCLIGLEGKINSFCSSHIIILT